MKTKQPLEKLLLDYQPRPGASFYHRMKNAPWNQKETMQSNHSINLARFGWQFAAGLLILIVLLTFSIPSVRAALSTWLGLSVAPSNQMPAPAVTLVVVTPATPTITTDVPTSTPSSTQAIETPLPTQPVAAAVQPSEKPDEIQQLSAQAGWEILTPAHLPEGYQYQSAYFDANHQMVILTYLITRPLPGAADPSLTASKTITLLQALKNDFVPMQIAPDTQVEDIQVNGQPGVFVIGAWDSEFVKDDNDPNGGKMVSTWRNDLPIQNIYGQTEKVFFVLVTNDEAVNKQDLLAMADSLNK